MLPSRCGVLCFPLRGAMHWCRLLVRDGDGDGDGDGMDALVQAPG